MEEFDWLSSNTKTSFPFTERQTDLVHELFVDAFVYHADQRDKKEALRLVIFSSDPGNERVRLEFTDTTLLLDLDPTNSDFRRTIFGAYTIFEWNPSTIDDTAPATVFSPSGAGFTDKDQSVKLVVLTAALDEFDDPVEPVQGVLIPTLVSPMAKGVRRLLVRLPDLVTPSPVRFFEVLEGRVKFRAGMNTILTALPLTAIEAAAPRAKRKILVDVVPGAGQGFFVNCDPSQHSGVLSINKVKPNELGNIALSGEECLWVETLLDDVLSPTSEFPNTEYVGLLKGGALGLHNDCSACCDCDDYVQAYEGIRNVWLGAKAVAGRFETMRRDYNELVPVIEDIAAGPGVKGLCGQILIHANPTANYALSLTVTVDNTTDHWLLSNLFEIKLKPMPGFKPTVGSGQWIISESPTTPTLVDPISTDVYDTSTSAYSMLQLALPYVKPKTRYSYRFSGRFDAVADFTRQNAAVTVEFAFKNNGGWVGDPNDSDSDSDPTPCELKMETQVRLVGPPEMS